jgi:integrase
VGLTGLRQGELLALQWKHIDLTGQKFRIVQSLWHGELVPPKAAGSIWTIYYGAWLAGALQEHFDSAVFREPENFVFCKKDGSPLHPEVLRKDVLYPVLDRLGLRRDPRTSGFHMFRHSAASLINAQTGNLKLAQKLLGHSTIDLTANIYTHVTGIGT